MDAIDKLLAELKSEYTEAKSQQQNQNINPVKPVISNLSKSASSIDNLLGEIKADFLERDAAEKLKRQQELEQEKILQAQLKVKQLETLKKQAKEWLSKLDPFSPEGLWFERFAESYPSKLEAAIEYLQNNK